MAETPYRRLVHLLETRKNMFKNDYDLAPSEAGRAMVEEIIELERSWRNADPSIVTEEQIEALCATHPELTAPSLSAAIAAPSKRKPRKREDRLCVCKRCGSQIENDSCSNPHCGRIQTTKKSRGVDSSAKDPATEKIEQFPSILEKLLARSSLPAHFTCPITNPSNVVYLKACQSDHKIVEFLEVCLAADPNISPIEMVARSLIETSGEYARLISPTLPAHEAPPGTPFIPSMEIRRAMSRAGLKNEYIWSACVTYYLTGVRPVGYTSDEIEAFKRNYEKTVHAYYKHMGNTRKNFWNIQAYIKLIMLTSPTLGVGHEDFYASLHSQTLSIESSHCGVWEEILKSEGLILE
jgi:hypothetical protein